MASFQVQYCDRSNTKRINASVSINGGRITSSFADISFDKTVKFPSVKISLDPKQMENKLTSAGKTLSVLSALATSVVQGADVDQLKIKYEQQLADASEAVTLVLQSGEGCDVSLLNQAMERDDYTEYLECGGILVTKAEIELAEVDKALAERRKEVSELAQGVEGKKENVSELTQGNQNLDDEHNQDQTTIAVLSKKNKDLDEELLANLLN